MQELYVPYTPGEMQTIKMLRIANIHSIDSATEIRYILTFMDNYEDLRDENVCGDWMEIQVGNQETVDYFIEREGISISEGAYGTWWIYNDNAGWD